MGLEEVVLEDGLRAEVDLVGVGKGVVGVVGVGVGEGEGGGGERVVVRKFLLKIWTQTWTSTMLQQWKPAK